MRTLSILAACLIPTALAADSAASEWILRYEKPAARWEEALPVGNGHLGAMVFGGIEAERIQFNEHTVWSGRPRSYARKDAVKLLPEIRRLLFAGQQREAERLAMGGFMGDPIRQKAYQPCGDLLIESTPADGTQGYARWLDLDTATAVTTWTSQGVTFRRETFASHPDRLLVTRISANAPGKLCATLRFGCVHADHTVKVDGPSALVLRGRVEADGVAFEARAGVLHHGGTITPLAGALRVADADWIEIRCAAATNVASWKSLEADPTARVAEVVEKSADIAFDDLRQRHLADHQGLFRRVSLDLGRSPAAELPTDRRIAGFRAGGDPQLAALLFQYGRYLLIASSRPGGQPANLQGIWNDSKTPPWDSKYTCNINMQMNYWPAGPANLAECSLPLARALHELRESGTTTAREHYGARGWALHHNFDLWRGTAPINAANHGIWISGAPWLSLHLWEHYLFTGDEAFLRESWPVIRDCARFFLDYLVEDPTGAGLISGPSNSPEQGGLVMGPTMDHQIIRQLLLAAAQAATLLGADDDGLVEHFTRTAGRIAPNRIGKHGQLQEWLEDVDDPRNTHRHVSHLWGVHPGADITWRHPEVFAAARQSLQFRGDAATGWSMGWKTNLWARFLDGDHAHRILSNLIQPVGRAKGQGGLYPNLFDAHPPFQIDGNFGVTAGIAEMLLQSHVPVADAAAAGARPRFVIHLLPALPKAWPKGSARGLRARGGIAIDIEWDQGVLTRARLVPATSGPIELKLGNRSVTVRGSAGKPVDVDASLAPSPVR